MLDREISDREISDEEISDVEMLDREISDEEISDEEISDEEISDEEISDEEMLEEETLEEEPTLKQEKGSYLFSVKFFLDLYTAAYTVMYFLPLILCIIFGILWFRSEKAEKVLLQKLEAVETEIQKERDAEQADADADRAEAEQAAKETEDERKQENYLDLPYTNLYPDFYAPEANYSSVNPSETCYLTFDDGPSERTEEIMEILEREGIHGTFFVTKQDTKENRLRLQKAAEGGHTIGMHTASHRYTSLYSSVESFLADYYELYSWIREVTGETPTIYRFPGGSINGYNRAIYQEIIAEMNRRGFVYFDWNVSSGDSAPSTLTSAKIAENCLSDVENLECAVILMHDSEEKTTTVNALTEIIEGYREHGFSFGKLSPEVAPVIFNYPD